MRRSVILLRNFGDFERKKGSRKKDFTQSAPRTAKKKEEKNREKEKKFYCSAFPLLPIKSVALFLCALSTNGSGM